MIKVNLANSILKKSDSSKSVGGSLNEGKALRDGAIKVALIIAPLIGIMYYEKIDLDEKQIKLQILTQQRDQLNGEIKEKKSVDEIVKNVKLQQEEMDDKFRVMEKIFGLRAKKIQALALLQKHIPQTLWLQKVAVTELATESDGPGKTSISIVGHGTNLADIQVYITLLEQERGIFESISGQNISSEENSKSDVSQFSFNILLKD
jgi:Tfp pilus assembly protein PilN